MFPEKIVAEIRQRRSCSTGPERAPLIFPPGRLAVKGEIAFSTLRSIGLLTALLLSLTACASIPADFKQPGVTLQSISPRITNGITPEFDIRLQVTNPNRSALDIKGLSYTLHLQGNKVLQGVANNLPRIDAYGKADVIVNARPDLLGGIRLLAGLLEKPADSIDFEFSADIDIGSFYPTIEVRKSGTLSFPANR